jgi:tartronate-semialdehyde synthase
MNFEVSLSYDGPGGHPGIDHVAVMQAMGAEGVKVTDPGEIRSAFEWAVAQSQERRVPALVEILVAPEDDAAMGKSIDHVREFEAVDAVPDPLAAMPELAG